MDSIDYDRLRKAVAATCERIDVKKDVDKQDCRQNRNDVLERIDEGDSYRSVARDTRFNRVTLMDIYKDEDRRKWYLEEQTADDDRVDAALEEIQ